MLYITSLLILQDNVQKCDLLIIFLSSKLLTSELLRLDLWVSELKFVKNILVRFFEQNLLAYLQKTGSK